MEQVTTNKEARNLSFISREVRRKRTRVAYDILGRRWREQLRSQALMDSMGFTSQEMERQRVGRRPPFFIFQMMVAGQEVGDPVQLVKESTPRDFLEYAAEFIFPTKKQGGKEITWRGAYPKPVPAMLRDGDDEEVPAIPLVSTSDIPEL